MNLSAPRSFSHETLLRVAILAGLSVACIARQSTAETQSFDDEASATAAGWTGAGNRDSGGTGTDFGFSASNNAMGAASGEVGGSFPRLKFPFAYYADTTIGTVTLSTPLMASGKIYFDTASFDGGIDIGWINTTTDPNQKTSWLGMEVLEGSPGRAHAALFLNDGTELVSGNITTSPSTTPEDFIISWDPAGGTLGGGSLKVELGGEMREKEFTPEETAAAGPFDAFGLLTSTGVGSSVPSKVGMLFLDDLNYTTGGAASRPADFNSDGKVDRTDYSAWETGFGTATGAAKANGDSNADGDVDGGDFLSWAGDFGFGVAGAAAASAAPEPTSCLLGAVCTAIAASSRRRRRHRA